MPLILGGDLNTNTFDGRAKEDIGAIAADPALRRRCLEDVGNLSLCCPCAPQTVTRSSPKSRVLPAASPCRTAASSPGGDWAPLKGGRPREEEDPPPQRAFHTPQALPPGGGVAGGCPLPPPRRGGAPGCFSKVFIMAPPLEGYRKLNIVGRRRNDL